MEKIIPPDTDRKIASAPKDIPGWGIDADPKNNPTYPIKHYNGADHERIHYRKPPRQKETVEILKSIERPALSSVFGTSAPPAGLSGAVRRFAFRYSESTYLHWVPLVMADRMDVIGGIIDDIRHGIFPNIFEEKGMKWEWKNNRGALITKLAATALATIAVIAIFSRKKKYV